MPILPYIYDNDKNLEAVVRTTAEIGGKFVLAGSLTLASTQKEWYYSALGKRFPELIPKYEKLYGGDYSPNCQYVGEIGKKIADLCQRFGIKDRIPRYIPNGSFVINKRMSGKLHNNSYRLELDCGPKYRVWAYRKAAWILDELNESVADIYAREGTKGLKSLRGIGEKLAKEIERELLEIDEISDS